MSERAPLSSDLADRIIFAICQMHDHSDLWAHVKRDPDYFRREVRHLLAAAPPEPRAPDAEEMTLRRLLWLGHGCGPALYGDDGEMQDVACGIDFKRMTVAQIDAQMQAVALRKLAGAQPHGGDAPAITGDELDILWREFSWDGDAAVTEVARLRAEVAALKAENDRLRGGR